MICLLQQVLGDSNRTSQEIMAIFFEHSLLRKYRSEKNVGTDKASYRCRRIMDFDMTSKHSYKSTQGSRSTRLRRELKLVAVMMLMLVVLSAMVDRMLMRVRLAFVAVCHVDWIATNEERAVVTLAKNRKY